MVTAKNFRNQLRLNKSGTCNIVPNSSINPEHYYLTVRFYIPSVIIISSYVVLWRTVKTSSNFMKQSRLAKRNIDTRLNSEYLSQQIILIFSTKVRQQISTRDAKMSRTVALVCACFLLFGLPGTVIRLADPTFSAPLLHASYFWIYWAQYRDGLLRRSIKLPQFKVNCIVRGDGQTRQCPLNCGFAWE